MSKGTRCPFELILSKKDDDNDKDKVISFKQPIDPTDPNGIKLTHNARVLSSTFIEDVLKHELQFSQLVTKMSLTTIVKRKAVYEATLAPALQTAWRQACVEPPVNADYNNMTLNEFRDARERFVLRCSDVTRSLAEDTRHWLLYELKKPRNLSVHDFQKRVNEISEYFPFMPRPRETFPVTPRIPTPDENDKIMVLHNACPKSWRDEQARTNQLDLDLQELLTYYSTLKSIEKGSDEDREKPNYRKKE